MPHPRTAVTTPPLTSRLLFTRTGIGKHLTIALLLLGPLNPLLLGCWWWFTTHPPRLIAALVAELVPFRRPVRDWTCWAVAVATTTVVTGPWYLVPLLDILTALGDHARHPTSPLPLHLAVVTATRGWWWLLCATPFTMLTTFLAIVAHHQHVHTRLRHRTSTLDGLPTTVPTSHHIAASQAAARHLLTNATTEVTQRSTTDKGTTTVDATTATPRRPTTAPPQNSSAAAPQPATTALPPPPTTDMDTTTTANPPPPPPLGHSGFHFMIPPLATDPPVVFWGRQLHSHGVIIGATGKGKSTTITRLVHGWMVDMDHLRLPLVLIDLRADPVLLENCRAIAALTGRRVRLVTTNGVTSEQYNPLRHGTGDEIATRLVTMLTNLGVLDETHEGGVYATESRLHLNIVANTLTHLVHAGARTHSGHVFTRTLTHLAQLCPINALETYAARLPAHARPALIAYLNATRGHPVRLSAIQTLTTRLEVLLVSGAHALTHETPTGVDLHHGITSGDMIIFSLDVPGNREVALSIANLAVTDLAATFARLAQERWATRTGLRCPVVADEFAALGALSFNELYERGRPGGASVWLAAQTPAAIAELGERFYASVMANSDTHIYHRVTSGADQLCKDLGSRESWEESHAITRTDHGKLGTTNNATGGGSWRQSETYLLHPNILRTLATGQAAYWTATTHDHTGTIVTERLVIGTIPPAPQLPPPPPLTAQTPPVTALEAPTPPAPAPAPALVRTVPPPGRATTGHPEHTEHHRGTRAGDTDDATDPPPEGAPAEMPLPTPFR